MFPNPYGKKMYQIDTDNVLFFSIEYLSYSELLIQAVRAVRGQQPTRLALANARTAVRELMFMLASIMHQKTLDIWTWTSALSHEI
jgi:hypothetical protein